jgi:ATP-binding cassette, subfamily B, bacterial
MVREEYPRDAVIVRQGDEGDKFYALAKGKVRVEVAHSGQTMETQLGPGDYFGEIALIHDVPRTATVRAIDKVVVWALSREDFHELQSRASEFKDSLLEVANARLQESTNFKLQLGAPAS